MMEKKLLILSESFETTTSKVMAWLSDMSVPCIRFNQEDTVEAVHYHLSGGAENMIIETAAGLRLDTGEICAYWYRRGDPVMSLLLQTMPAMERPVGIALLKEWENLRDQWMRILHAKGSLGAFDKERYNNKLKDLALAQSLGFRIPATMVTSSKAALVEFRKVHGEIITKTLRKIVRIKTEERITSGSGTQLVTDDHIALMNDHFLPSLFQEKLEKAYEIRVFCLGDQLFPMAIFSQNDARTSLDFRNYNREKPNRNIPFRLPAEIAARIRDFLQQSGMDTGSIDIVRTISGEYVFLEINPVGQFGWVSSNCNYYLEKKVARHLAQLYHLHAHEKSI